MDGGASLTAAAAAPGSLQFDMKHDDRVSFVVFAPESSSKEGLLLSASDDGLLLGVNTNSLAKVFSKHHLKPISALQFAPSAKQFFTLSVDRQFCQAAIYNRTSFAIDSRLDCQPTAMLSVMEYSPNGDVIATGSRSCQVVLWGAKSGESRRVITTPYGAITSLAFTKDSVSLAVGSEDCVPRVFSVASGEMTVAFKELSSPIKAVVWIVDHKYIAAITVDAVLYTLDVVAKQQLRSIKTNQRHVTAVRMCPGAVGLLYLAGTDGSIKVWDTARTINSATDLSAIATYHGHKGTVTALAAEAAVNGLGNGSSTAGVAPTQTVPISSDSSGLASGTISSTSGTSSSSSSVITARVFSGSQDGTTHLWMVRRNASGVWSAGLLGMFLVGTAVTSVDATADFSLFAAGDAQGGVHVLTYWDPDMKTTLKPSAASRPTQQGQRSGLGSTLNKKHLKASSSRNLVNPDIVHNNPAE